VGELEPEGYGQFGTGFKGQGWIVEKRVYEMVMKVGVSFFLYFFSHA